METSVKRAKYSGDYECIVIYGQNDLYHEWKKYCDHTSQMNNVKPLKLKEI